MTTLAPSFLIESSSFLQMMRRALKIDEFKFWPDTTTDSFDRMFFIFADNKDNHKFLDEFNIRI